ncbi:hypothetical protein EYF80_029389 [Liparis tanakae]|uniref:Uncharacterized protein n=1 Tax=Liparis tanakae TaxID=230148 RepID=A0A4Z2H4L6_9TELE|nr:hypothetical protein EYF80_029389 [Liparis tanakae]
MASNDNEGHAADHSTSHLFLLKRSAAFHLFPSAALIHHISVFTLFPQFFLDYATGSRPAVQPAHENDVITTVHAKYRRSHRVCLGPDSCCQLTTCLEFIVVQDEAFGDN